MPKSIPAQNNRLRLPTWSYVVPIGIIGVTGFIIANQKQDTVQPSVATPQRTGDFSATVEYQVPGTQESITVKAHLENDVITQVDTVHSENDRKSARYQQSFQSEYKTLIVGKNIDELRLDAVGGASVTTVAFMKAIKQLQ